MNSQCMDIILPVVMGILATEKKRNLAIEMVAWSSNGHRRHVVLQFLWGATEEAVWEILRGTMKGNSSGQHRKGNPCPHGAGAVMAEKEPTKNRTNNKNRSCNTI